MTQPEVLIQVLEILKNSSESLLNFSEWWPDPEGSRQTNASVPSIDGRSDSYCYCVLLYFCIQSHLINISVHQLNFLRLNPTFTPKFLSSSVGMSTGECFLFSLCRCFHVMSGEVHHQLYCTCVSSNSSLISYSEVEILLWKLSDRTLSLRMISCLSAYVTVHCYGTRYLLLTWWCWHQQLTILICQPDRRNMKIWSCTVTITLHVKLLVMHLLNIFSVKATTHWNYSTRRFRLSVCSLLSSCVLLQRPDVQSERRQWRRLSHHQSPGNSG